VLQCGAVCCSVLQYDLAPNLSIVCCSVLQCVAVCCSVLQCVAVCCSVLQYDLAPNLSIVCVEGLWHITQILDGSVWLQNTFSSHSVPYVLHTVV